MWVAVAILPSLPHPHWTCQFDIHFGCPWQLSYKYSNLVTELRNDLVAQLGKSIASNLLGPQFKFRLESLSFFSHLHPHIYFQLSFLKTLTRLISHTQVEHAYKPHLAVSTKWANKSCLWNQVHLSLWASTPVSMITSFLKHYNCYLTHVTNY